MESTLTTPLWLMETPCDPPVILQTFVPVPRAYAKADDESGVPRVVVIPEPPVMVMVSLT